MDGSRPFCTGDGVGAVLSVIGPRDSRGNVVHPTKVVSVNEPCDTTRRRSSTPTRVCGSNAPSSARTTAIGQIVPIRGAAPADPAVPADAVTASGSGLDPHISTAYADLQVNRVAKARGVEPGPDQAGGRGQLRRPLARVLRRAHGQRAEAQHRTGPEVSRQELTCPVDDEHVTADPYRSRQAATTRRSAGSCASTLGAAPGVGKTFAMLGEAHRRLERGTDLVAAVVETHGRKKTAELIDGHRGGAAEATSSTAASKFPELDVEAVLRRQPQVVLVDELAHTNTPGSKNPKRWQDVEELLDAGHHRHLHGQRPAPGEPQRRRHPDHRHRAAGEGARRGRPRRRPDRAGRHHAGSVAAQACPRQRLRTRARRRRAVELLPARKPHGAARIGAAVAGRPGRRGAGEVPRREQDHRHLGGARTCRRRRHRWAGVGNPGAQGISHRIEVQRRADGRPRRSRRRAVRCLRAADGQGARAGHQPRRHPAHRGRRRRAQPRYWISPAR